MKPKLIFLCILISNLVDIVLMLLGEILSWSLMGVTGIKLALNAACVCNRLQIVHL